MWVAKAKSSSSVIASSVAWMWETTKFPFVKVPVLSKTAILVFPKASRYVLPFIKMPFFAQAVIPPQKESGIEITRAQGQLTTKNINAL